MKKALMLAAVVALGCSPVAMAGGPVKPAKCHIDHLEDGIMAIIHYGLNTYCDKEWGYGDTPASIFNPTRLDTDQWVEAMVAAGIKRVVMVTKHHDGFNLWPSPYNSDYTVANTPWLKGKGDLVKMIHDSCLKRGLKFGVYLSPWDRHQAIYATDAYPDYYHNQFEELFTKYGPLCEIWLDGANGGDGWYGGAKERRKLKCGPAEYYRYQELLKKMHERFPDAIAFGGAGEYSSTWVGNEDGYAPDTLWYEEWGHWQTPECDTPLRPGWFWHPHEAPKSLAKLVDIYFCSVGRGCVLNLGIAPNRDGLVGDDDVKRLKEFGDYVREFNAVDLAEGAKVIRSNKCIELKLKRPAKVNCMDAMEEILDGQKIGGWKFEAKVKGKWQLLADGVTIGYRRLSRFDDVVSDGFRLTITGEKAEGAKLKQLALRYAKKIATKEVIELAPIPCWNKYYKFTEKSTADELFIDFTKPDVRVKALSFYPKRNKGALVDKYELYASEDGEKWTLLKAGEFGNVKANPVKQWIYLEKPVCPKHLKLKALHAVDEVAPSWNRDDQECVRLY